MPGKGRLTPEEERQVRHIIHSEEEQGRSEEDAERIGYSTVNKQKSKKRKSHK